MQAVAPHIESEQVDFDSYLENFRATLQRVFHVRADIDKLSLQRGLPPYIMREILSANPLAVWIPSTYGGRGGHVSECMSVLETAGYESLALCLTIGINGALFLQPVSKYGQEEVKGYVFDRFLKHKNMGGLMITEPEYGSDALSMQTSYSEEKGAYHIQGVKHWGGLTGWADFWLLTARRRAGDDQLTRDIDFFICDVNSPGQSIHVEEYFNNLGLYLIPYGRNRIDVHVPKTYRLEPHSTGIKMMLDTLHRSRTEFPGMGMGFLRRMLDEALQHCQKRFVGGASLFNYDQVKKRIARMQASFTACSAMCVYSSSHAGIEHDLSRDNVAANSIKSVVTDLMQEQSQSLLQLVGAKGYRLDHIAGRATVDSRPFQIFEGSNDILYQQISESVLKAMRRVSEGNLFKFLKDYHLTARASDYFKETLNFEVDIRLPQRKLIELGRVIGRVVTMDLAISLGERGFRSDLVSNCLQVFKEDVEGLLAHYRSATNPMPIVDYQEDAAWLKFVEHAG
ncbi:MAG TPA: acyl-CoA dehydrogenase family protein [Rhodothermales bacterium]|nr:acyl-CoA dehydrogenase family protein [Rhodothermales bacterium]